MWPSLLGGIQVLGSKEGEEVAEVEQKVLFDASFQILRAHKNGDYCCSNCTLDSCSQSH